MGRGCDIWRDQELERNVGRDTEVRTAGTAMDALTVEAALAEAGGEQSILVMLHATNPYPSAQGTPR